MKKVALIRICGVPVLLEVRFSFFVLEQIAASERSVCFPASFRWDIRAGTVPGLTI